ncbi:MAG TPA: alpha-galactosidase [Candidatus Limnocylindrales bacterium]|nr:alpha-galactosidase [Candidatus Limnocylindrales bacterium]
MTIHWDAAAREWHLENGRMSYAMRVLENGWLSHLHGGAPLRPGASLRHLGPAEFPGFTNRVGEPVAFEVPVPGIGDFRVPGLLVGSPDGSTVLDLRYDGHRILAGKPELAGLPSTYVENDDEAETLEIDLRDATAGLRVVVRTTLFADRPVVARSLSIHNEGDSVLTLRCAMSAVLDLPDARWQLVTLSGQWARERHVHERPLLPGRQGVGSVRGASGHEHNPFLALRRPETTEDHGEALGVSLVYSANFLAEAEVEPFGTTRVRIGIHPDGFVWRLEPGTHFTTPEAILAWSDTGLGGLSEALHELFRDRLASGSWRDRVRPIVLNSWEATYFDFDHDRLVAIASQAKQLGVELFVLDDGWFGRRDRDDSSLGDWVVDRRKLPGGLEALVRDIRALGLSFGLWIEPEMVSPDSDLYRAHPDWAIGVPGRALTESRQQLVLDMARAEVVDHLTEMLSAVLASAPIEYVKWDMNRNITEPWSASLPADRQGEFHHRYILGVYELYRRLTERFPDVLFESCAGGGGRFDPGLLAFAPQVWTSDDTDAVERTRIQWGTSIAYPPSSMAAHVSAVPNHQTGRITPLFTRAAVAMFGVFGYELDPTAMTDAERAEVAGEVAWYLPRRELLQRGRFLRLRSPFAADGNETAWMVASGDGGHAIVGHFRTLARPGPVRDRLRLRSLDPAATYRIRCWTDGFGEPIGTIERAGDELMSVGLGIEPPDPMPAGAEPDGARLIRGDFQARLFELVRS